MNITKAELAHLPRILTIQKVAYLSEAAIYGDYSLPPLRQSLEEIIAEFGSKTFFKAEVGGTLVGSVRAAQVGDSCFVEKLVVEPKYQKQGIGSALLVHAESAFPSAKRFELFTGSRSMANIALYERHGYVVFRQEALSPSVSLVYMQKLRAEQALAGGAFKATRARRTPSAL